MGALGFFSCMLLYGQESENIIDDALKGIGQVITCWSATSMVGIRGIIHAKVLLDFITLYGLKVDFLKILLYNFWFVLWRSWVLTSHDRGFFSESGL